ncbi:hypothetical protein LKR43_15540 [Pusillimonas sp. MFBS29]|uniref:cupredoxin domain-containing protein n=1 Tax=Pusillimonas sp. MFBS29 TaxID=2886690 RepID=UPI001D1160B9|nr:hypothetical protein [Pusillimonas sp. MFBS29]MCC2597748.1 hypothetical protein [Pusillimonas sp. MFBS29]
MNKLMLAFVLAVLPMKIVAMGANDARGSSELRHDITSSHGKSTTIGRLGDLAKVNKTVAIIVNDTTHFTPSLIDVKAGDTVLFVVKNTGKFSHEMVIGSMSELRAHAALMQKAPNVEHTQPNMITLNPGQQRNVVWQFIKSGKTDFACLIDWHLKFGTLGEIQID